MGIQLTEDLNYGALMTTSQPEQSPLVTAGEYLSAIRKFGICPVGIVVNVLCVVVLLRGNLRKMMLLPYMVALATADSLYLSIDLVNEVVARVTTVTSAYCKFSMYVALVSGAYSDFVTVVMAINRLMAVCMPLQTKVITDRKVTMVTAVIVFVFVAGIYVVTLWSYGVQEGHTWCTPLPQYKHLTRFEVIFGFVKTLSTATVMAVVTIAIVVKLRQNHRSISMSRSSNSTETHATMMLLCTITVFLITNLPLACYVCVQTFSTVDPHTDFFMLALLLTFKNIGLTCDFFLYFLASSMFREEVRRLFVCSRGGILTRSAPSPYLNADANLPTCQETSSYTDIVHL